MNGINKQLFLLNNKPVLYYSIKAFMGISAISEIIVVTRQQDTDSVKNFLQDFEGQKPIKTVIGGQTRQQSVINGLNEADQSFDYVLIHDGARPLVNPEDVKNAIEVCKKTKACTLGVPVKDTVKQVDENNIITSTPNRSSLYLTQTPQLFEKTLFCRAVENAVKNNLDFTDDCQLAESMGQKVTMVKGSYKNIKITTPEDIKIAKIFLEETEH